MAISGAASDRTSGTTSLGCAAGSLEPESGPGGGIGVAWAAVWLRSGALPAFKRRGVLRLVSAASIGGTTRADSLAVSRGPGASSAEVSAEPRVTGCTVGGCGETSATDAVGTSAGASCGVTSATSKSGAETRRSRQGKAKPGSPSPSPPNVRANNDAWSSSDPSSATANRPSSWRMRQGNALPKGPANRAFTNESPVNAPPTLCACGGQTPSVRKDNARRRLVPIPSRRSVTRPASSRRSSGRPRAPAFPRTDSAPRRWHRSSLQGRCHAGRRRVSRGGRCRRARPRRCCAR